MNGKRYAIYVGPGGRKQGRLITNIKDAEGNTQDTQEAILRTMTYSISGGYNDIPVNSECAEQLCRGIQGTLTSTQQAQLESPVTEIELRQAILQGARRKSPGVDGIMVEFYRWGWKVIKTEMLSVYNVMFQEEYITKGQARGINVYVPKKPAPEQITDYRPITLLNSDYKIYGRILANRMPSIVSGLCTIGNIARRRGIKY
jgi:hypothetical protein